MTNKIKSEQKGEKMKALVLLFDDYAEYGIDILTLCLKNNGYEIVTSCDNASVVTSQAGFKVVPHGDITSIAIPEFDILIIPGGPGVNNEIEKENITKVIRGFYLANKVIAAIGNGPILLAKSRVLNGHSYSTSINENQSSLFDWGRKSDYHVAIDENIITATEAGYVDFAMEVLIKLNLITEQKDREEMLNRYKLDT
jgi:putative intracellular protease/amidase